MFCSEGPSIEQIHAIFHIFCINGIDAGEAQLIEGNVPPNKLSERHDTFTATIYGIFRDKKTAPRMPCAKVNIDKYK